MMGELQRLGGIRLRFGLCGRHAATSQNASSSRFWGPVWQDTFAVAFCSMHEQTQINQSAYGVYITRHTVRLSRRSSYAVRNKASPARLPKWLYHGCIRWLRMWSVLADATSTERLPKKEKKKTAFRSIRDSSLQLRSSDRP
jgi:hypothetical protein